MKSKILLVNSINLYNFFIVLITSFFFKKIFYLNSSEKFRLLNFNKYCERINIIHFSYNIYTVEKNFKIHDYVRLYSNRLSKKINKKILNLFENKIIDISKNDNFNNFYLDFLISRIHNQLLEFSEFMNVRHFLSQKYTVHIYNNDPFFKKFFKLIFNKNFDIDLTYFELLIHIFIFIPKKIYYLLINFNLRKNKIVNDTGSMQEPLSNQKVAFFPHKGIYYSDHYLKDYFYSNDKESIFFNKNIIHFSYNFEKLDNDTLNYYKKNKINYLYWFSNINFSIVLNIFFNCILFWLYNLKTLLTDITTSILSTYFLFNIHKNLLIIKKNNKIKFYLVGFDVLFPKDLSLSLKLLNKITIANQGRLLSQWWAPKNFFNYYFSYNDDILLKKKFNLNKILPIGSIHTKNYHKVNVSKDFYDLDYKYKILVVDQNLNHNFYKSSRSWGNNINSSKKFYKSIITLSEQFQDCLFIMRSKDNYKLNNNILKISDKKNILLNDNKSFNPYENIKSVDIILGIHSSLLDDAFFWKKPIIICDYNMIHYNIKNFGNELYAFNKDQLIAKFCEFYDNPSMYLENLKEIHKNLFADNSDSFNIDNFSKIIY